MALGALTLVDKIEGAYGMGKTYRCTLVGDGAYGAGGSTGLLAKLKALTGQTTAIVSVHDESAPAASLAKLEYDMANEKLFARVKTTGVESAVADQSAITYTLVIIAKLGAPTTMAAITRHFGEGGKNLTPSGASASPSLATALRDIADDLAALKAGAAALASDSTTDTTSASASAVVAADGVAAAGVAPDKAEFDAVVALANATKAALNVVVTLANELKTDHNALRASVADIRTKYAGTGSITLKTTKA